MMIKMFTIINKKKYFIYLFVKIILYAKIQKNYKFLNTLLHF